MAVAVDPALVPLQVGGAVGWAPEDLHAWQVLRPLLDAGGYLPWDEGAMRPAGLVDVCNLVVRGGAARVVELGAGSSTLLLGRLLRERGGRLTAIESDTGWAAWVAAELAREGLTEHVACTWVPLGGSPWSVGSLAWYDPAGLSAALHPGEIDLLIVDGPPADKAAISLARRPALFEFAHRLADDAVVVLDDIVRQGERDVLSSWEAETDWRFERRPSGIAIGRR